MLRDITIPAIFIGILSAFVGFASSFAVVIQGLISVGATEEQAASGLMILAVTMGLATILLSFKDRIPVTCAWSTPGAALLVAIGAVEGGFEAAVGAFIICNVMIFFTGVFKPLARVVETIPTCLASAMLAGVLLGLCIAPFKAVGFNPLFGLPILIAWTLAGAVNKLLAVPAALCAFIAVVIFGVGIPTGGLFPTDINLITKVIWVDPIFNLAGLLGIALPLFVVTMASQNLTGIAVMKSFEFPTKAGLWFSTTGALSILGAPFGAHGVNLAAITAAICAGEEAHPDKSKRYWSAIICGIFHIIFGLSAAIIISFVTLAPAILIQAVAGLALISAFIGSTQAAFTDTSTREAAAVTFLFSASGISIFGISGAFWGLIAGGFIMLISKQFNKSI